MRRLSAGLCTASLARFSSGAASAKTDLFGYEVDTNTAPWIEKIKNVKYYDEAGEVLVDMNVKNCPPDLATYNATLQKIFEAGSKQSTPVDNESKFCAMMDLLEEMSHRNRVKPNAESWTWIMKECVKSKNFRVGYVIQRVLEAEAKSAPADLVAENQANADKAKSEGKEHPGHLAKQVGLFDIQIE
ncbi:ribonucleoprotein mitochondrial precursor, putative [Bodo saltans]|uniref:Ribonucleoprotein mitochondrial, putative n=2 Tax=Bodo saltans TaxID=75058 RepID=A0A0S4JL15_BODSA|nr:ribonucleoprotein mitochondrial precursor, putative [Bodo saltans]|eukprot:CUG92211.1 ribonucleoprotein mitochondrial precursor, putative [Bodo saltans]